MKRYFLEIRNYAAGLSNKGRELQDICTRFHCAVVFSHEALMRIFHDIELFAKVLDKQYPRTKPFAHDCIKTGNGYQYTVNLRPGANANTCFILHVTEISSIYDLDGVELKRIFEKSEGAEKGGKR